MITVVWLRKISVQAAVYVFHTSMMKRRSEFTTELLNPILYVLKFTECRPPEKREKLKALFKRLYENSVLGKIPNEVTFYSITYSDS